MFSIPPNLMIGLFLLSICLIAYIAQTFTVEHLQTNLNYTQPYFMLWVTHSSQIFVFPLDLIYRKFIKNNDFKTSVNTVRDDCIKTFSHKSWKLQSLLFVTIATLVLTASFYMWYYSAGLTNPTTVTIIYNTNCFFAYLFSVVLGIEKLAVRKVLSLVLAIGGVLIVLLISNSSGNSLAKNQTMGNIMVSVSSVLAGLYEVIYTAFFCKRETSSMFTTFLSSYIGVVTLILFSGFIPILHFLKIEEFQLPNQSQLTYLLSNIILGVCFNTSFFALIEKTSPLFTSVGLTLVVPLTPIIEKLINSGKTITWNVWVGTIIVFFSFFVMVYPVKESPKVPSQSIISDRSENSQK